MTNVFLDLARLQDHWLLEVEQLGHAQEEFTAHKQYTKATRENHANNLYVEEEYVPSLLFAGRLHRTSVRNFTIQILSNVWSTYHEKPCPYFLKQP